MLLNRYGSSLKVRIKRINSSFVVVMRLRWILKKVSDKMRVYQILEIHLNCERDFSKSLKSIHITTSWGNFFIIDSRLCDADVSLCRNNWGFPIWFEFFPKAKSPHLQLPNERLVKRAYFSSFDGLPGNIFCFTKNSKYYDSIIIYLLGYIFFSFIVVITSKFIEFDKALHEIVYF